MRDVRLGYSPEPVHDSAEPVQSAVRQRAPQQVRGKNPPQRGLCPAGPLVCGQLVPGIDGADNLGGYEAKKQERADQNRPDLTWVDKKQELG